ncbi:low molecular weight protein arginine phosphatase [Candidatus Desantisbacteria bacterium]|nr:low molecular weight protein arginine phosphatase [Candidatus Desantisbacteria bacterium]
MAEGLAYKFISPEKNIIFMSCGTCAYYGIPASIEAQRVMKSRGIDISSHRSQPVSHDLVNKAECIFGMTKEHTDYLKMNFPECKNKLFLLKDFTEDKDKNIHDPIGLSYEEYSQCADELERCLKKALEKLK